MPNYKEEVLAALGKALRDCGIYEPTEYRKFSRNILRNQEINGPFDIFVKFILANTLGASFRLILTAKPIRTQKERDEMIQRIEGIPQRLRPQIAEIMSQLRQAFPQKKRGPQSSLTPAQKSTALSTIDTLRRNGSTLKYAIEAVARQFQVSPRLMRKYYEEKTPVPS